VSANGDDPRAIVRYALVGAALTVVLMWMLYHVRGALLLIYVAAVVAIGLSPLVSAIERREDALTRHRVPRWLAILTIYLLILGTLVAIGMLVMPPLAKQMRELWTALPELLHRGQQWLIDRGLLSRELSVREAVERAPVGGGDEVGTVVDAVLGQIVGLAAMVKILILAL
jgi:predicted PurR-regulated permease PerM